MRWSLVQDRPEQVLRHAALFERQVAGVEQADRHVERLLRVVKRFERVACRDVVVGLDEVGERLLPFQVGRRRHLFVAEARHTEDVEDQHAVVRHHGASALRDDGRVAHARLVAYRLNVIDDVVGVLLERVVHARFEVRLRAVVVHSKPAADVDVLEAGAELGQLRVDARGLVECALDDPDVGDLAAEMEVEQLEAVLHAA